jgi:uncharacterized repeat protein (TIGR01451 family)
MELRGSCWRYALLATLVLASLPRTASTQGITGVPLCAYACNGHCGEVISCLSAKGVLRSATCGPCTSAPAPPWENAQSTAASCNQTGQALELHPSNKHYFRDTATGQSVLIASFMNIAPTVVAAPGNPPNYISQVNNLASSGIRYARVWHLLPWEKAESVVWPWAKSAQDGACYDPQNLGTKYRYNLNQYDAAYWLLMRGVVPPDPDQPGAIPYASGSCITSEIMLFDKSGMLQEGPPCRNPDPPGCGTPGHPPCVARTSCNWTNNPWARDNNTSQLPVPSCVNENPPDPPIPQSGVPNFYQLTSSLLSPQEAYVRTMINRTIDHNVIYEVENEHRQNNVAWANKWGPFIKGHMATIGKSRLVSYSSETFSVGSDMRNVAQNTTNGIDIINLHYGATPQLGRISADVVTYYNDGKAVNVDEFANGVSDPAILRKSAWTILASGGNFHFEDVGDAQAATQIVSNIHSFLNAHSWNFVGSRPPATPPSGQLLTDPYCMVADSASPQGYRDYLCYTAHDYSSAGLKLASLPAGQYSVTWWNPLPGGSPPQVQYDHYPHAGGDLWTPPAPNAGDWVLMVRNEVLPKAVDMAIKVDDGKSFVRPGDSVTYTIEASNVGYDTSATGGFVTDAFPPDLTGVTWTCTASGGATWPGS